MANSLKDQLLRSGLVSKHQVNTAKNKKHVRARQQHDKQVDEAERLAREALAAKTEKDRQLNQERDARAREKAIAAQVRQLIVMNRVPRDDGDVAHHFTDGSLVKSIHVSEKLTRQIADGQLAIVRLDDGYELVPVPVAEKIRLRDEECVVSCEARRSDAVDDEYADYQIPDDLMW